VRLGRFEVPGPDGPVPRVAAAASASSEPVDVAAHLRLACERRGASSAAARRIAAAIAPGSMTAALESGQVFLEAARAAAYDSGGDARIAGARQLAPLDPPSFREFMAFPEHFERVYDNNGQSPPPVLYEIPVSYMGNATALVGPEDEIAWPAYSSHMDYELELGIVIGRAARDVSAERALEHVIGLTILNDFSARDIQMREMTGGLGPSKGKHFASAVGPWIVTLDELDTRALAMEARINGELWSRGSSSSMRWSVGELVAWASAAETLPAGALLGSGTVGTGCGLELGRRLRSGDVVELTVEGIGGLRNRVRCLDPVA
jgi:2-keto-4-pentenoate hydratase/2-oxohepta-3-ene-1,7-dioic acid hydratase in catechol pathway